METKKEERTILYELCPYCKKEIKGTSESQVLYNLKLHMEKCNEK